MKYFKITLLAFVAALCLCLVGVNATQYVKIRNIKIKLFQGVWWSEQIDKGYDGNHQKVKKISCTDDLSGDGRAILGNIKSMLGNGGATGYRDLPQGTNVDFGNGTTEAGGYKLSLKSNKWLASTASAGVNWDLGSLLFPNSVPYEVAGN